MPSDKESAIFQEYQIFWDNKVLTKYPDSALLSNNNLHSQRVAMMFDEYAQTTFENLAGGWMNRFSTWSKPFRSYSKIALAFKTLLTQEGHTDNSLENDLANFVKQFEHDAPNENSIKLLKNGHMYGLLNFLKETIYPLSQTFKLNNINFRVEPEIHSRPLSMYGGRPSSS